MKIMSTNEQNLAMLEWWSGYEKIPKAEKRKWKPAYVKTHINGLLKQANRFYGLQLRNTNPEKRLEQFKTSMKYVKKAYHYALAHMRSEAKRLTKAERGY